MLEILRQGMTPTRLAITIAVGFCIGCFPLLGVTTVLCVLVAFIFRMNQAAIQVGNYLAFPLQLLLTVPFLRLGEFIFHTSPLPLAPNRLLTMARTDPDQTARAFVAGQGHAIIAWALIAPVAGLLIAALLIPLLRLLLRSTNIPATRLDGTAS